ncbi:MAG TPA: PEP-CTERM sorting domain-containing protein [Rhizomicrobium sp.]|nr:PEP-CTERM sorting domain-containing protein [Rhizomicrobium sp.]
MSIRIYMIAASFGVAALLSVGSAIATPVLISGCTVNVGTPTQTCNFYETDANGAPSEISSTVSNQFSATTAWHSGYSAIDDPGTTTLSDVIVWNPISPGSIFAETANLYSCDDGALPTNCSTAIAGLTLLGTGFEDANGDLLGATKSRFNVDNVQVAVDTLNVFSGVDVPEPITLSIFGVGLAGAVAVRRRRKA